MKLSIFIFGLAIHVGLVGLLGITGCGKDRTLEDYKNNKVVEDLNRLQAVSGTYQGTVVSQTTGEIMGALKITLTPSTRTTTDASASATTGERRAVLAAQIQYTDAASVKSIQTATGFYDWSTQSFQFEMPFEDAAKRPITSVSLAGQLLPESMSGKIEALMFSEYGGTFNLTRGGNTSRVQVSALESARINDIHHVETAESRGILQMSGGSMDLTMTVHPANLSTEQEFLTAFRPIEYVTVAVNFGDVSENFPMATWDLRTHKLYGTTVVRTNGGDDVEASVNCDEVRNGSTQTGWKCNWRAGTVSYPFNASFN